jgi:hypothetical protein
MNDALVQSILGFTLDARKVLEREADEQLQGIYGWLPDGTFTSTNKLPAVVQLAEAKETRARLERFKDDEATVSVDAKAARKKLLRETAFTWLNRLVAFRMMEERRLLKKTITQLMTSPAYLFWLADEKDPEARKLHDAGEVPANPMGEGPRHVAYRRFVLWQCGELARGESVLFDPGTLPSRLCPRPPILKQLVEAMNAETLAEAWKAGNEEVLGWTYEGFIEDENNDVFEKFSKGKKVLPEEIGAATQRFTPRWIVRFLVENSLGRVWLEMHPDSRLAGSLTYFVPVEKRSTRPVKPVRNIDFLDPSCGSMHFGLVAFDLFVEMYREELERAGQPGWPARASVDKAEEIPSSIVRHNLFGIDIDLRAVQIAALTILIKARTLQPGCAVTDLNFACANMEQISGGRLDAIVSQAKFKHPIYDRVLRGLVGRMKNSDQLGSLLRPEKILQESIAEERRKAEENLRLLPGFASDQFETTLGLEEFFSNLSEQILQELDNLVRTTRAAGQDPGHLVAEASKGLRFLRLVSRHYDVVATNPPYMSRRNVSAIMATHLDDQFKDAKGDLYAAFIVRCAELADMGGKVAMVTQQSFMFISSYEELRVKLRAGFAIETMAHLGPRAFPNITGEKVNTTAFVLEQRASKAECDGQKGVYFRLVGEPDADSKRRAFEAVLGVHTQSQPHPRLFSPLQKDFDAIIGAPWVYWMTIGVRSLFIKLKTVGDFATTAVGQNTGENKRFLRFWWEVGATKVARSCRSAAEALELGARWFPYMKGGTPVAWWGNQAFCINWQDDGAEVKALAVIRNKGKHWSRYLQNLEFLFQSGVTWSDVSSKGFAVRISPGGFIHDVSGMGAYPKTATDPLVLSAVLNSRVSRFILAAINPTIHYQAGDIRKLPHPDGKLGHLSEQSNSAVKAGQQDSREDETTYDFNLPLRCLEDRLSRKIKLDALEAEINAEVSRLYGLSDADLTAIDRELSDTTTDDVAEDGGEGETDGDDEDKAQCSLTPSDWVRSWISYAVGTVVGRFEIGKPNGLGCGNFLESTVTEIRKLIDPDSIMPCDNGHPQDLAAHAVTCLELMLGAAKARDVVHTATSTGGDPVEALRGWLDRFTGTPDKSFWKYHFQLYRKRPVYWPLQSPRKKYTVWVFHERFDKNTLFTVRNLVEERFRLLEREIADKRLAAGTNRCLAKDVDKFMDVADDLREFSRRIKEITDRGYSPHIDDGVLLNAAPLHPLLPSWPETKTAWEELEAGEYDWAQQAMEYWPARVKAACKTNKSFAIAHGLA